MAARDGFSIAGPLLGWAPSNRCVGFGVKGFSFTAAPPIDNTPPVVTAVTPVGEVAADDELVVDVTDDTGLAYVILFAIWEGQRKPDLVYRKGAFQVDYTIGSYVEAIEGGYRIHVRRDVGWPPGDVSLDIDPVDTRGNLGS